MIRTGSSQRKTTLTLGVEDAQGTIFFKNVGFYLYSELTDTNEEGEEIKTSVDEQFV